MPLQDLLDRVGNDPLAASVTVTLIGLQLCLMLWLYLRTIRQLALHTEKLTEVSRAVRRRGLASGASELGDAGSQLPALRDAFVALLAYERSPKKQHPGPDPEQLLEGHVVLPNRYNQRLDVAAPGLFTACGIVGTFIGLVLGFLRIDINAATQGVGILIGGMSIAFLNSLVGIVISICWTIRSRHVRHQYDNAVAQIRRAVVQRMPRITSERRLYVAIRQMERATLSVRRNVRVLNQTMISVEQGSSELKDSLGEKLDELKETTSDSSRELAQTLAPQLEESLGRLVSAPFENLVAALASFDQTLGIASQHQAALIEETSRAAAVLNTAQQHLAGSAVSIREHFDAFTSSAALLTEHIHATERLVETSRLVLGDLDQVRQGLSDGVAQVGPLISGMQGTREALVSTSDALAVNADMFRGASDTLERAVKDLGDTAKSAVDNSLDEMQAALQNAAAEMARQMAETGQSTVAAYKAASDQVTDAIDATMSDLAERIRAELATLAGQLPAEMAKLHEASAAIRRSIKDATASLDSAVAQLGTQSSQVLKRHLDDYEVAVKTAVDHFSGTLGLWDERVEDLETAAKALTGAANRLGAGRGPAAA